MQKASIDPVFFAGWTVSRNRFTRDRYINFLLDFLRTAKRRFKCRSLSKITKQVLYVSSPWHIQHRVSGATCVAVHGDAWRYIAKPVFILLSLLYSPTLCRPQKVLTKNRNICPVKAVPGNCTDLQKTQDNRGCESLHIGKIQYSCEDPGKGARAAGPRRVDYYEITLPKIGERIIITTE